MPRTEQLQPTESSRDGGGMTRHRGGCRGHSVIALVTVLPASVPREGALSQQSHDVWHGWAAAHATSGVEGSRAADLADNTVDGRISVI
jgi:hypothetical protein